MIFIEPISYRWEPAPEVADRKKFEEFIAKRYVEECVNIIESRRNVLHWRPLSVEYRQWKKDNGMNDTPWWATGKLKSVLKVKKGNIVGADGRYKHEGKPIRTIVREMEYGSTSVPARPLFRPVLRQMERDMEVYINEFESMR